MPQPDQNKLSLSLTLPYFYIPDNNIKSKSEKLQMITFRQIK